MLSRTAKSGSKPAPSSISGAIEPSTLTLPSEGESMPQMILSIVDLPDPLGPMIPSFSPLGRSSDTASSTRRRLRS